MAEKLQVIASNHVSVDFQAHGEIPVPEGIPPFTTAMLQRVAKKNPVVDPELKRLQYLHDGPPSIIHDAGLFPPKDAMAGPEWEAYKKLMVYVNLVKPAVRRLVSGTYGGTVQRTVQSDSWYKSELEYLF